MKYMAPLALAIAVASCSRGVLMPDMKTISNDWSQSVTSFSTVLGQKWTWSISSTQLSAEPDWEGPGASPPPLSLEAAVEISRRDLSRYFPEPHEWVVHQVTLQSVCCPKRWFYTVGWQPKGTTGDDLAIPVLLSGSTVALSPNNGVKSDGAQ